jgi:hypothetical protein
MLRSPTGLFSSVISYGPDHVDVYWFLDHTARIIIPTIMVQTFFEVSEIFADDKTKDRG